MTPLQKLLEVLVDRADFTTEAARNDARALIAEIDDKPSEAGEIEVLTSQAQRLQREAKVAGTDLPTLNALHEHLARLTSGIDGFCAAREREIMGAKLLLNIAQAHMEAARAA